jgi:hypothetical protein
MTSPDKFWSLIGEPSDGSLLQDERGSLARDDTYESDCVSPASFEQGSVY